CRRPGPRSPRSPRSRRAFPQELQQQYSPSRWARRLRGDAAVQAHIEAVTRARASTRTALHVPYGEGDGERLDLYLPEEPSDTFPAFVYIHGGYWQSLSPGAGGTGRRRWWRWVTTQLPKVGAVPLWPGRPSLARCPPDPALCPGHMDAMVLQVRRSLAFLAKQYPAIRGIYLCGHSAGAHLAAMVLCTDWTEFGVVPDIRGAVLVSGVYDLEPILHTYVNDALNMSREVAQRNSPMLCVTQAVPAACEVLVAVAQHDSPEFRRQSQEYSQALRSAGWAVSLLDLASVDHFDIIEKLSEDTYILTQSAQMVFAG
uniref:Arylformamidase n=1 Tax=Anas platyrhynchos TaxID=8839 RepID=A0A8B9R6E5_ANAPL